MRLDVLIWLVPAAVTAAGIWRPRAGLVVLAAALPLFGSPPGGPYLAALDVAGIAAVLTAWRGGRARASALGWPAAAFVAVSLLSWIPLAYRPPSWRPEVLFGLLRALPGVDSWPALYTWRAAADLLLGWSLFLAARRAFADRSVLPLVWGLVSGLAATVVLGLASHAGLLSLDAFRPNPSAADGRLASLFFLAGWLSQYLVLVGPLAFVAVRLGGRWLGRAGLLLVALTLACVLLTQQRGAWVAVMAQLTFWLAVALRGGRWDPSRLRRLALGGVAAIALAAVVLVGIGPPLEKLVDRVRNIESGLTPRVALWEVALELVPQRPLLGWGLGGWAPAYDIARPPEGLPSRFRGTAHNLYLHVAAERGLVGLAALGLLAWAVAACLRRPVEAQATLALALGASLVGLAVYGLVQYVFYLRTLAWTFWLLLACVALVSRHRGPAAVSRAGRALAIGALLLLPLRALLVEAPAYAGNREYGLHAREYSPAAGYFRWAERTAGQRILCFGSKLVLNLANGHPRAGARPVTVVVGIDGRRRPPLRLAGGWEEHSFELDHPRLDWLVVTLESSPTFRPFSDFRSYPDLSSFDIRLLGVAVLEPRCE